MNPLGIEAQKVGKEAEERVITLAQSLGYTVETSPELDYANKTDCIINGVKVQISVKNKSSNQVKLLRNKGIVNIVAGSQVTDQKLAESINLLFTES